MNKGLVNIKGSNSGLIFTFNNLEASFAELCAALEEKLLTSGDFFINAEYIIADSDVFSPEEIAVIERIMDKYHMQKTEQLKHNVQEERREDTTYQAHGGDTVMIMRGVRSGQKLNIRGNAVIMGDINPGGEIIASGSIIVMGTCRGLLHAGAEGDKNAYIVAYVLASRQLRIAEHVATLPEELKETPLKVAIIQDDSIFISDYQPTNINNLLKAQ